MHVRSQGSSLATQASWAMGSLVLALMMWSFLNGPRLHTEGVEETVRETELENQDACKRINMPSGAESYSVCVSTLDEVRRPEDERTLPGINGPL